MVVIYSSHTAPVNPPGAIPVLSQAQLWAGMQRKERFPQEFVPVIASCEVVSEDIDPANEGALVITRDVTFKEGFGPPGNHGPVREVIKSYEPVKVDFHQKDGSVIQNFITTGVDVDGEEGLYLTFVIPSKYPAMAKGSKEHRDEEIKLRKVGYFLY